jgi:hypothetical protein
LSEEYYQLRKDQDGLSLLPPVPGAATDQVRVRALPGPASVMVTDTTGRVHRTNGVFLTVNPLEFGIEVIQVVALTRKNDKDPSFSRDETYFLDGEVTLSENRPSQQPRLIRQPVGLFSLKLLRGIWKEHKSLGQHATDSKYDLHHPDCKFLPEIPGVTSDESGVVNDFHVFRHDYEARRQLWKSRKEGQPVDERLDRWLHHFGSNFQQLFEEGHASLQLRSLTPAVWKTLEQALALGLLDEVEVETGTDRKGPTLRGLVK